MDLDLTPGQEELAAAARTAFAGGGPAPVVEGSTTDLVVVARELGRAAVPSTFHTEVLGRLVGWRGAGVAAVALEVIAGVADSVAHAAQADALLVRTQPDELIEIDPRGPGVSIASQPMIGDDERCRITLSSPATQATLTAHIDGAVARAAIVLAADAVGAAEAALAATVAHVRDRQQWGVTLGSLQAVQHRCADMLIDVTLARDAVLDAAGVADCAEAEAEVRLAASYAKATAIERCRRVTASAHQLAGGQGIYADAPFHRWYRRVKAAEPVLGDNRRHRAAVAAALFDP